MERVEISASLSALMQSLCSSLSSFVFLSISTANVLLQFESGVTVGLGDVTPEDNGSSLSWLADEGVLEECLVVFGTEMLVLKVGTVVVPVVILEVQVVVMELSEGIRIWEEERVEVVEV